MSTENQVSKASKYLAPELAKLIPNEIDDLMTKALDPKRLAVTEKLYKGEMLNSKFEIIYVQANNMSCVDYFDMTKSIIELANHSKVFVGGVLPPVMVFYIGLLETHEYQAEWRLDFVQRLLKVHKSNIRILHGSVQGYVASIAQFPLVGLIDNGLQALEKLHHIPFGQAIDLK